MKQCSKCGKIDNISNLYQHCTYQTVYIYYCIDCCEQIIHAIQIEKKSNQNWIAERQKQHKIKYYPIANQRKSARKTTDIVYRLKILATSSTNSFVKQIKNNKLPKFNKYLKCNGETFKQHIEKQFTSTMNWENYAIEWEIDHIISLGIATSSAQLLQLTSYNNTRPLHPTLNKQRSKKYKLTAILS